VSLKTVRQAAAAEKERRRVREERKRRAQRAERRARKDQRRLEAELEPASEWRVYCPGPPGAVKRP
jgi:hypothetical protein